MQSLKVLHFTVFRPGSIENLEKISYSSEKIIIINKQMCGYMPKHNRGAKVKICLKVSPVQLWRNKICYYNDDVIKQILRQHIYIVI